MADIVTGIFESLMQGIYGYILGSNDVLATGRGYQYLATYLLRQPH
jgi:hypothetical protein